MPVIKISQFPTMSQADVDSAVDVLAIVDTSDVENKKITLDVLGSSITASHALTATSASYSLTATSASYSTTSSYAITASYALNGGGGGVSPTVFGNYTSSVQSYFVYTTGSKDGSIQPVSGSNSTEQGYSTIAGGKNNSIEDNEGDYSNLLGGGECNTITSGIQYGFIGSGFKNCLYHFGGLTTIGTSIVGGMSNTSSLSPNSFIGTGCNNKLSYTVLGFIGSGTNNLISGPSYAHSIVGGENNTIIGSSSGSSIVGGENNIISSSCHDHFSGGGQNNLICNSAFATSILGGTYNTASANCSIILSGCNNVVDGSMYNFIGVGIINEISSGRWSTILNGAGNEICDNLSTILNGVSNLIDGQCNTIAGGSNNIITSSADHSAIVGGERNCINTPNTFIGAGSYNTGSSTHGFIGAGENNSVGFDEAGYNSVVGGCNNKSLSDYASILGGYGNCIVGGTAGSILGGVNNYLDHACSFIAGNSITSSAACTFHVNCLNIADLPTSDPGIVGTLYRTGSSLDEIKVSV